MKYLKGFGLTAVAAISLIAFAGGGIARADLFTDSAKTTRYPTGTVLDLSFQSGSTSRLTDSEGATLATCTSSTVKGKTSNETGKTVSFNIETLTWGGCNQTTDTIANGQLEIKWTSANNGEVIGRNSQWTMNIFGVSCSYGTGSGTYLGTITGGAAPILKIETTITKTAGGFLCAATTGWDAEYVLTEPHALYVGPPPTTLFTDSVKTTSYPTGTVLDLSLKSGTSTRVTSGSSTIATCTGSTAKGKTSNETGEVVSVNIETLTWSGCNQTTDTIASGKLEIKWTSGNNGEVIGKETQWTVQIFGVSCTYGFGAGTHLGTLVGGEEPTLKIETTITKTAGGFLCPGTAGWDAEYVVTEPHAVYVGP